MFRRLGWIFASYFTRPLILALVAGGVVFGSIAWFAKQPTTFYPAYPQMLAPHLLVDSKATLDAVRREGRQAEVDAINLKSLWVDMHRSENAADVPRERVGSIPVPGESFVRIVEEFPNLRIVTLTFLFGQTTGGEQLARIPHLEYLEIDGWPPADLSWLGRLDELRWLELTFFRPLDNATALGELPRVETVVFRSRYEVSDEVLEAMANLPHLKQLVLDFYGTASGAAVPPLTAAGFASLGRSKSLETLYLGSAMPQEQDELMALARKALPGLDIEPPRNARRLPFPFHVFPVIFWGMGIGFGLAAQFRGPLSRLAPGFVASHVVVASALFAAIALLGATRLIADGNDPLASITVSAALVAAAVCVASGDPTASPTIGWKRLMENLLKTAISFCVLGLLFVSERASATMLEGHRPWMLALLGLVTVAAIVITVNSLRGLGTSSASTSLREQGGYYQRWLQQSQFRAGWTIGLSRGEHQIDAWKSGRPRWTWWNRVQRWRVGNAPSRNVLFMLLFLSLSIPFLVLFRAMLLRGPTRLPWPQEFNGLRIQFLFVNFILLLVSTGRVAFAWRARMLTMPLELLRPYTRRALQNEMAAAFLLDLVPPALLVAAIGAFDVNFDSDLRVGWARVPLDFGIIALASLAITAGLGALIIVVKRDWVVRVLFVMIGMLTAAAVSAVTAAQMTPSQKLHGLSPHVVESQLWLLVVVGIVLAGVMRQRFMRMEIGSRV